MTDGTHTGTTLVTGAAHGIGRALADVFAESGYDLVLVDIDGDQLAAASDELVADHGVEVDAIERDLSRPEAPEEIYSELEKKGVRIDVLVNNAGVGTYGPFHESDVAAELNMVNLNVAALTHLTRLFVGDMVDRGAGAVLNVSSTAAFNASPMTAVYSATKAYILLFTEAVAEELRGTGVEVTVLCPGHTSTKFFEHAGIEDPDSGSDESSDPEAVARAGYRGLMEGKTVVFSDTREKLKADAVQMMPRSLARRLSARLERGRGRRALGNSLAQRMGGRTR
jgi:hypothetical protein